MFDPVTGAVIIVGLKYVGQPGAELVKDFLGKILTPVAETSGEVLAHPIKEFQRRRVDRANQLVIDAATIADKSGLVVHEVPGRILWPLLEKGSVEEDDELRRKWAQLLANACTDSSSTPQVLPAFVHILGELSPLEVRILDWLLTTYDTPVVVQSPEAEENNTRPTLGSLLEHFEIDVNEALLLCINLERLSLLTLIHTPIAEPAQFMIIIHPFAIHFVRMCRTPGTEM
jgi:hypothetical protein